MQVIILSAGRGERLRPLTDSIPKPLIEVGGEPLIVRHIKKLKHHGFDNIVINISHLGDLIKQKLGNGELWGVQIQYSEENPVLETGGGIRHALSQNLLAADSPFLCVNSDILCDIDFASVACNLPADATCHLVLVDNPPAKISGDFSLINNRINLISPQTETLTYSGVGVYRPQMFADLPPAQHAKLYPLLLREINAQNVSGEKHHGVWYDAGTHDSLLAIQKMFSKK